MTSSCLQFQGSMAYYFEWGCLSVCRRWATIFNYSIKLNQPCLYHMSSLLDPSYHFAFFFVLGSWFVPWGPPGRGGRRARRWGQGESGRGTGDRHLTGHLTQAVNALDAERRWYNHVFFGDCSWVCWDCNPTFLNIMHKNTCLYGRCGIYRLRADFRWWSRTTIGPMGIIAIVNGV